MHGPRVLSVEIVDDLVCGGAHPDIGLMAIVSDLTTGAPVDWTTLVSPALTGTVALGKGADGTRTVTLASETPHTLHLEGYRPETHDPERDGDAGRQAATDMTLCPHAMMAWLDAEAGGLAVRFDLVHVAPACTDAVVIPTAILRRPGARLVLTGTIEAAHAAP